MRRRWIILRAWKSRPWREVLLAALTAWNRHQVGRIIAGVFLTWLVGGTAIYLVERGANPDFATWGDSLWNVWLLLFSGLDTPPKTTAGRLVTSVLLVLGVGLAGLFTASVASLLIERYLRRRDVENFEMGDHLVLCNWSPRGLEWIREVHAKTIQDKRGHHPRRGRRDRPARQAG
jgi:voltage-gated potassium channel